MLPLNVLSITLYITLYTLCVACCIPYEYICVHRIFMMYRHCVLCITYYMLSPMSNIFPMLHSHVQYITYVQHIVISTANPGSSALNRRFLQSSIHEIRFLLELWTGTVGWGRETISHLCKKPFKNKLKSC